jgi:uncharacterized protein (TIGR00299 family) protein
MQFLVFDPFHGAAGDMIIGALLDCGADRDRVMKAMRSVVSEPSVTEVYRAGIRALRVDTRTVTTRRTLSEVMGRLDEAKDDVPPEALAMAKRVFMRINDAEEKVHGAHAHFHEVGADDAIADVIGACTALHCLRIDGVAVRPVIIGGGSGIGSHGVFPIPAPATAEILRQSALKIGKSDENGELCTPTGAALLAEFSTIAVADLGTYSVKAIGYGAGARNPAEIPNVIRAMVVETTIETAALSTDSVDVLETNIDDVSGEVIANALIQLLEAGARDASAIPVIMKKGRPGFLIRVICSGEKSMALAEQMARELGTLGIRCIPAIHRFIADRTIEPVEVEISGKRRTMPVKYGKIRGKVYTLKAEFEPARIWAAELRIPVHQVLRAIEKTAWKSAESPGPGQVTNED